MKLGFAGCVYAAALLIGGATGALAQIVQANVTREALDEAFAAAAEGPIDAQDYLSRTALEDKDALGPIVDAVIAAHPEQVETYRGGKEGVLGFLVGQVMRDHPPVAHPALDVILEADTWARVRARELLR